jgi:CRP/FNR family transcriptional regulator
MDRQQAFAAIDRINSNCAHCIFPELCMWTGIPAHDLELLDRQPYTHLVVRQGETLYRAGDRFSVIYAIRSGFFQNTVDLKEGRHQIVGFRMPGDVMGLEGISASTYMSNAIALEDAEVCAFPLTRIEELSRDMRDLAHRLHQVMSREIARDQRVMTLLGSEDAEVRVAAFLADLSHRFAARGHTALEFDLPMSREQIASYLGLTIETVSRRLTKLQADGLIAVKQRRIRILDLARLEAPH